MRSRFRFVTSQNSMRCWVVLSPGLRLTGIDGVRGPPAHSARMAIRVRLRPRRLHQTKRGAHLCCEHDHDGMCPPGSIIHRQEAAVAVCNLGLENWPPLWRSAKSLPDDFLVNHDLITVFQVAWTVLHKDVGMYAAERLQEVLAGLRCDDCNVHTGLDALRIELSTCCRAGMP